MTFRKWRARHKGGAQLITISQNAWTRKRFLHHWRCETCGDTYHVRIHQG
jgi:hypothetical protein